VDHKRRYQVIGLDDLGDVHVFRTDNKARAEGVAEAMREELDSVDLVERSSDAD
jgi:hypothetical protein